MCTLASLNTEQQVQLRAWLDLNTAAAEHTRITGYSLGNSYIDARANGGKGIALRRKYVKMDKQTAKLVPAVKGFTVDQVRALLGDSIAAEA